MVYNRPRKSIWPAISIIEAFQIINNKIDENFDEALIKSKFIEKSDVNLSLFKFFFIEFFILIETFFLYAINLLI